MEHTIHLQGMPTAPDIDSTVTSLIEANPQDYYVNQIDYEKNKKFAVDQTKALSGNTAIMANPDDYKIEMRGNRYHIVYPDGTLINTQYAGIANAKARAKGVAEGLKAVKPMQDVYNQQQDMYRQYLSTGVSEGVTSDLTNIEEQYNQANTQYDTLSLELSRLQARAEANPDDPYLAELVEAKGQEVSDTYLRLQELTPLYQKSQPTITDAMTDRAVNPELPEGATVDPKRIKVKRNQLIDSESGQLEGNVRARVNRATATEAQGIAAKDASTFEADESGEQVDTALEGLDATQVGFDDPRATITAATQDTTAVSDLNASQGTASIIDSPVQRDIQAGELVSGSAVDAEKAALFTEQVQAAQADPSQKTSVAFQLEQLMNDFDDGQTPAWAAGAIVGLQRSNGCTWAWCTLACRSGYCTSYYGISITYCTGRCPIPGTV